MLVLGSVPKRKASYPIILKRENESSTVVTKLIATPNISDAIAARAEYVTPTGGITAFPRSYLLTLRTNTALPADLARYWVTMSLGPSVLHFDPLLPVSAAGTDKEGIAVLGLAIDPDDHEDMPIILALESSRTNGNLDEHLDRLNGRYVVITWTNDNIHVQSDATGMRGVYYHAEESVVAGSPVLIGEAINDTTLSYYGVYRAPKVWTAPGRRTQLANVYRLGPNMELDLRRHALRRVGPMPMTETITPEVAARRVIAESRAFLSRLLSLGRPVTTSLTAGFDSRVTLALLRDMTASTEFFTYTTDNQATHADAQIASEIANSLGLEHHRTISVEKQQLTAEQKTAFDRSIHGAHSRALTVQYTEEFSLDTIHIRSTVYELGRVPFGYETIQKPIQDWMASRLIKQGELDNHILADLSDYQALSHVGEVPAGYLPQDIFYWEARLGGWMLKVLGESDMAFETVVPLNSRRIIRTLHSVPHELRAIGSTFDAMINEAWPELFKFPVNGKMRDPESSKRSVH